ncbi:hypothetical protein J6590_045980, partial [Homalodisca vitripennis]
MRKGRIEGFEKVTVDHLQVLVRVAGIKRPSTTTVLGMRGIRCSSFLRHMQFRVGSEKLTNKAKTRNKQDTTQAD